VEGASQFMHNEIGIDVSKPEFAWIFYLGPSSKNIPNQVFSLLGKASAMEAYLSLYSYTLQRIEKN
jgi:hypothetical protein